MSETFRLVFRAGKSGEFKGSVTAVYDEPLDHRGMVCTYEHVGQHGAGSLDWYRTTRPATADEYTALLRELTGQIRLSHPDASVVVGKRLTRIYN